MPDGVTRTQEQRAEERLERRRKNARARRAYRLKRREARGVREPVPPTEPVQDQKPHRPRERQGIVVSAKAAKTITVRIDVTRQHRVYKKTIRESSTLHAHDERNDAGAGDTVRVVECRPLSRLKRWRLVEVMERAR